MADVCVRELKQRLSEYLDRAERGELLRVTDRGRPKGRGLDRIAEFGGDAGGHSARMPCPRREGSVRAA